ncbi:MAG: hypothetical protein IJW00_09920 [Clostridia bacterium]|nr:hypothetical protein [Clostridia bacterium]
MCKIISCICLFAILMCATASCAVSEDDIKQAFTLYTPSKNVVLVVDDEVLYFSDHMLELGTLTEDSEPNLGYVILNQKVYFSTVRSNGLFDFSLLIYECDLYGNGLKLLYQEDGFQKHPWAKGEGSKIYCQCDNTIASYDVLTGIYAEETDGQIQSLSDVERIVDQKYSVSQDGDILAIVNKETSVSATIDLTDLKEDELFQVLQNMSFKYQRVDISNQRILLTFRIDSGNQSLFPILTVEFDFDTQEIRFASLHFVYDYENIDVRYVE